ncbi:MAG: SEC-C domain-containing protein, partial [Paramuribaculum intestinale]
QRTYIYSRRHHALLGERIGIDIANMFYDYIENLITTYDSPAAFGDLSLELFKTLTIEAPFTEEEFRSMSKEEAIDRVHQAAIEAFDRKNDRIREVAMPVIKDCVENRGLNSMILVPITDGKRVFSLPVNIIDAYNSDGRAIVKEWHKAIMLVSIDELWKEHLRELDQLKQSVQNVSYEQKDPLVIYKVESFHLFENMLNNLNVKVISALMRGQLYIQQRPAQQQPEGAPQQAPQPEVQRAMPESHRQASNYRESRGNLPGEAEQRAAAASSHGEQQRPMPVKAGPKIGRNDLCPCGSGKKYKNCHGQGL